MGGGGTLSIFKELKYTYPQYVKELVKKKINGNLITSKKNKQTLKDIYKNTGVSIKTIETLKNPVSFTIFKNKIVIYFAEEKPFVVLIIDKRISGALKAYFDVLWAVAE